MAFLQGFPIYEVITRDIQMSLYIKLSNVWYVNMMTATLLTLLLSCYNFIKLVMQKKIIVLMSVTDWEKIHDTC